VFFSCVFIILCVLVQISASAELKTNLCFATEHVLHTGRGNARRSLEGQLEPHRLGGDLPRDRCSRRRSATHGRGLCVRAAKPLRCHRQHGRIRSTRSGRGWGGAQAGGTFEKELSHLKVILLFAKGPARVRAIRPRGRVAGPR
jgi:hypothetical protein